LPQALNPLGIGLGGGQRRGLGGNFDRGNGYNQGLGGTPFGLPRGANNRRNRKS
jgi:hypothetical protein